MKRLLAALLALMLLMPSAMAGGFVTDVTPITIDGVRTAFFDDAGQYLPVQSLNGVTYVPFHSFCRSAEVEAEAEGTVIRVDGVYVGLFDADGNYLAPVEKDGVLYVPLMAFCQSAGVAAERTDEGYVLTRGRQTAVARPTPEPEEEHPEYVPVPLTNANFSKYFSASISVQNFRNWREQTRLNYGTITFQYWSCTYQLRVTALTGNRYENVRFSVTNPGVKANKDYDVTGVTFSGLAMPQSGELTRTQDGEGTYISSYAFVTKASDVLNDGYDFGAALNNRGYTSVTNVSGTIYLPWEEVQGQLESQYQQAVKNLESGSYAAAITTFGELAEVGYRDAAAKQAEARTRQQEAEEQRNSQAYAAAAEALANGDYDAAIEGFRALKDYRDSEIRLSDAQARQKEEKNSQAYAAAAEALALGDYESAIEGFRDLGDYRDSQAQLTAARDAWNEHRYARAQELEQQQAYDEAIKLYQALGNYLDSAARVTACRQAKEDAANLAAYEAAEQLEAAGDYAGAYEGFAALGDYRDSADRAAELKRKKDLQEAEAFMAQGDYKSALKLLGEYPEDETAQALLRTCNVRSNAPRDFSPEGTTWISGGQLMDVKGNFITPADADKCNDSTWRDGMTSARGTNGRWGFVNALGEWAIPPKFDTGTGRFYEGYAMDRLNGKRVVFDKTGTVVAELDESNGRSYAGYLGEGLISFKQKNKLGVVNFDGKVIVKPTYYSLYPFNHGLASVSVKKGNKVIYAMINPKGKEVIKQGKLGNPNALGENLISYVANKGTWRICLADAKGKQLTKEQYSTVKRAGDLLIVNRNGNYGALDMQLNTVIPLSYSEVRVGYHSEVVALRKGTEFRLYHISDLNTPLIDKPAKDVVMSVDSPYIGWQDSKLGWYIYDYTGKLIH